MHGLSMQGSREIIVMRAAATRCIWLPPRQMSNSSGSSKDKKSLISDTPEWAELAAHVAEMNDT